MLNSTKTWQKELWDKFKSPLGYSSIDNKNNSMYDLEKFISDLRKRDMEALVGMMEEYFRNLIIIPRPDLTGKKLLQLIKDYYEN